MDKNMKILIVDDFSTMRRIIKNLLRDLGFTNTAEADDGNTALPMLQSGNFDFLVTDWNMPGMTGIDLLKAVRADAKLEQSAGADGDGREPSATRSSRRRRPALTVTSSNRSPRSRSRKRSTRSSNVWKPRHKPGDYRMTNHTFPPESLHQARALVSSLEAGNEADVNQLLDTLGKLRESSLFHELGKLTRELHETINSFHLDARIADLTQKDIPDAKERLNYVITMTEQAANRTLDAVEQSLPLSTQLQERAAGLRAPWQQARAAANGALNGVGEQIYAFIDEVENDAVVLQRNLSDALMAQDYQDLTGQIIRRVITLVHDVEQNLVGLVRLSGQRMSGAAPAPSPLLRASAVLEGPRVPTLDKADSLKGQDDVDDLLSSLGF